MNETIGVKGGNNDRRRSLRISKKQKKKLQDEEEQREIAELEKKVKKQQRFTLIRTLPIVLLGSAFKTLYDTARGKTFDREEEKSKLEIKDHDEEKKEKKNEPLEIHQVETSSLGDTSVIDEEQLPEDVRIRFQKLKAQKIIDVYEEELKDIRYELRQLASDYQVLAEQESEIVYSEEADEILHKLSDLIGKIEELKRKIQIEDYDQYDGNYLYTLIEDYLLEFRDGNVLSEVEDSPLYVLIAEKLNELDGERDSLTQKVQMKKELLEEKEELFEELKERFFSIERMNQELLEFQNEQDTLLREVQEKIEKAISVEEKVKIEVSAMNRQSRRLLSLLSFQMMFPGPRGVKRLASTTAAYLYFASQILHPQTTTRKYRVITVKDYSREIENSMQTLEDASKMLERTTIQVDKMIDEVYASFEDYIGVVPECDQLLSDLSQVKSDLEEKEYEMEKIKQEQEQLMEQNNAKVLRRGEYPM